MKLIKLIIIICLISISSLAEAVYYSNCTKVSKTQTAPIWPSAGQTTNIPIASGYTSTGWCWATSNASNPELGCSGGSFQGYAIRQGAYSTCENTVTDGNFPCGFTYTRCELWSGWHLLGQIYYCRPKTVCTWVCDKQTVVYEDCAKCEAVLDEKVTSFDTGINCTQASPENFDGKLCGKEFIGGCNGSRAFCETSPVYQEALGFSQRMAGYVDFSYSTVINNNTEYICVNYAINPQETTVLFISGPSNLPQDPSKNSNCITRVAYDATKNTVCDNSLQDWGKHSGFYLVTGSEPVQGTDANNDGIEDNTGGTYDTPNKPGTCVDNDNDGKDDNTGADCVIDQTGGQVSCQDADKDGYDDRDGHKCESTGKPCIDNNNDGLDDETGNYCIGGTTGTGTTGTGTASTGLNYNDTKNAVQEALKNVFGEGNIPDKPVYDTDVDKPEEKDITDLLTGFISSNPLISVFSGSRIDLSGSVCSVSGDIRGRTYNLDFCRSEVRDWLNAFGVALLAITLLFSLLFIFG